MGEIKVGASILSADFSNLKSETERAKDAGVDFLHIDIMDGHFVDNITMGPCIVDSISKVTDLPQYAHLMIDDPVKYTKAFIDAGVSMVTFHIETVDGPDAVKLIKQIKDLGCKVGIAINPDTQQELLYPYLNDLDLILAMSVYPGFSGQKFIEDVLVKIKDLREKYDGFIEVDGGVNPETGKLAVEAGADVLVAASYIFKSDNIEEAVRSLKQIRN